MRSIRILLLLALLLTCLASGLWADPVSGTLYFTTYNNAGSGFLGGTNLWRVAYSFTTGPNTLTLGANIAMDALSGADGLVFSSDGNLMVGGQGPSTTSQPGNVIEVNPTTNAIVNTRSAGQGAYNVAINGNTLFSSNNGGTCVAANNCITQFSLTAGALTGAGTVLSIVGGSSHDVRGLAFCPPTVVACGPNGTWFYGTAADGATNGDFGTVTFAGGIATLTTLSVGNLPAHGLTFDPFTGNIIISSSNLIEQWKPGTGIVGGGTFTGGGGDEYDQTAIDGKGHLFAASNSGNLLFLDYDGSGNLGAPNFSKESFLAQYLDDVAPLTNLQAPVPEPTSILLFGTALVALAFTLRKRRA